MNSPLDELLPLFGLERLRARLTECCRPAIAFDLNVSSVPLGGSRVGGRPELPSDCWWPSREVEGVDRPLDFLLQIRLPDLPASELPRRGTLTFFYDRVASPSGLLPSETTAHRVLYTEEEVPRQPFARPGGTTAVPEQALDFRSILTVPPAGSLAFDPLVDAELTPDEQDRYFDFEEALAMIGAVEREGPHHHLLGHSENVQGDMQVEAQLVSTGVHCVDRESQLIPGGADLPGVDEWTLLLQLDSDDAAEFEWGDTGMLYFWIRKQDLKDHRFDRTWLRLQSL